jgi:Ca2+-binding RTX toxin-like protein/subtilisin-like proprotein convertase family protein
MLDFRRPATQIAFIDANVPDRESLINGLQPGIQVVLLDAEQDGVAQITKELKTRQDIVVVHIVSHGSPGCLYLGNAQLNLDTLERYTWDLQSWFPVTGGELLLYGCQVAAGDAGAELIAKLHKLTNAEIAASASRTGNAANGGDWNLEVLTSSFKPQLAFLPEVLATYKGVLVNPVNNIGLSVSAANTTNITIPNDGAATPYPAPITVSGVTGNITNLTVTLTNVSHTFPNDIDILLVGPGGQTVLLMSDAGGNADLNNVTLTFDDSAAASLPDGSQITAGTYKPTDFNSGDTFNAPAPVGAYGTALSAFNGTDPNGTWNLYVVDDTSGDLGNIADGWSLNVTTASNTTNEDTSLVFSSANNNPISVTDIDSATVTVDLSITDGTLSLSTLSGLIGSGNGTNTLSYNGTLADINAALNGLTYTPTADFNGTSVLTITSDDGALTDTDTVNITVNPVNDAPVNNIGLSVSAANTTNITIPNAGAATPYPAPITVSGVTGNITNLTVTLNNVSHTFPDDIDILLVGPGGQTVLLMSDAGGSSDLNNVTLTFDDSAAASLPDGSQITAGTYKPSNFGSSSDTFDAPAPAGAYGTALGAFNDTDPNGTWNLYIVDDAGGDVGNIADGWSLNVTTASNTTNEDTSLVFSSANNNPISVTDIDSATVTVDLSITDGTLSLSTLSGLIGSGNGTNTLSYNGTLADINAALNGLTYAPTADFNGTSALTITTNDGTSTDTDTVSITVNPVNDEPGFTPGANQTVTANAGQKTVTNWATGFNPGPADESSQTALTYNIVGDANFGILTQIAIDPATGTLTYTPVTSIATPTTTTISVEVQDSGGTANGGDDTSETQTFTITVNPIPNVTINDISVSEATNAPFTVTLDRTSSETVTVNYTTADGTAEAGSDYTTTTNSVTFNPGEISKNISVPVINDSLDEFDETFNLNLTSATNANIIDNQGVATIIDGDAPPTVSINDVAVTEGTGGTTNAVLNLTLSAASGKPITVNYKTTDDAATSPADFTAANSSVTFNPGETTKAITIPITPDSIDEINETFTVDLTGGVNVTIADEKGFVTIIDDDNSPTISIGDVTLQEGTGGTTEALLTVNLSAVSSKQITVNYTTANGTAIGGNDYTNTAGTLTFNPGDTSKQIPIAVNPDASFEFAETFTVNLSQPTNATIADNQGVVTLTNDDNMPQISINDVTLTEGTGGTTNAEFTISLIGDTSETVTVNYATSNSSAIAGQDYTAITATPITFNPGETSKTISVPINTDSIPEPTEAFYVNLTNPTNATIADDQGIATINDDDNPVSISISDVSLTEGTGGTTNAVVTVNLSGISGLPVTVNYATSDGTANAGSDYTAQTGSITFNPNETSKTITVAINPDSIQEPLETFNVSLTSPTNATIADNTGVISITDDDKPIPIDEDCFCDDLVRPNLDAIPGVDNSPNLATVVISGNNGNNTLNGTIANDQIYGFEGNDWISALEGDDNIFGGTENDTIYGGQGRDWILGEAGNDFISGNAGGDWINSGLNNDTVYGGQGNDYVRGGKNEDLIFGDLGNDILGGDNGNDTVYGGADSGTDLLFGGSGNDLLLGDAGNDTLFGNEDSDTIRGGQNNDIGVGDAGNDLLYGDAGNDSLCGDDGNDSLYGGGNGSSIPVGDSGEQDWLCGGKGNDWLFGNEGRDNLNGGEGDDTLRGGHDDDIITGGAGNDWLTGDAGVDFLRGGSGFDFFVLTPGKGTDAIADFTDGEDFFALSSGITFQQLNLIDSNGNTLIQLQSSGQVLAVVSGLQSNLLSQQDFIPVFG